MMDAAHKTQLLTFSRALITAIEADNEQEIEVQLGALTQGRDNNMFIEICKLTRDLHAAINSFNADSRIANLTQYDIPESRDRLDYVVTLTEQAAHQTLQAVDKAIPAATILIDLAQKAEQASTEHFSTIKQQTHTIQSALTDITMAQGFQDLTGQVIRKVIDLIEEVETNLVRVIKIKAEHQFTVKPNPTTDELDPLKAEGPQINTAIKPNVMSDQGDVDELLSSLGF